MYVRMISSGSKISPDLRGLIGARVLFSFRGSDFVGKVNFEVQRYSWTGQVSRAPLNAHYIRDRRGKNLCDHIPGAR